MKTKSKFRRGLAVFWLISLAAIGVGLGWLWGALETYEAATPEAAVRRYLKQVERGEWETLLAESDFTPSALVPGEDYIAWLKETYAGLPQETSLVRTGEAGGNVYLLRDATGEEIAKLELTDAPAGEKYAYRVKTRTTTADPVVIEAPQGAPVRLNGRPLPDTLPGEVTTAAGYEELPEGYTAPQRVRYELEGLLQPPQVTVEGDGYQIRQSRQGKKTVYQVTGTPAPEEQQAYLTLAQRVAKTYAAFVTRDATRAELNAELLPGTPFYKAMQQFYNGWYVEHTGHEYRNIDCSELEREGENAFSVRVSFDYVVLRGSREHLYPSDYRLFFLKTDAGWKLVRLDTL